MKKALLPILLTVALLLAGCANAKAPVGESTVPGTDGETQTVEATTETTKTAFVYERETFQPTNTPPVDTSEALPTPHVFYSIRDLETYLSTGSEDLADYSTPPFPNFPFGILSSGSKTTTMAEFFRGKYCSLETAFGIDADQIYNFESVRFMHRGDGAYFLFFFSNASVSFTYAPGYCLNHTAKEYYCDVTSNPMPEEFDTLNPLTLEKGDYIRKCGDTNVVYRVSSDGKRTVFLIAENFLVQVGCGAPRAATPEQNQNLYQKFLTSPEFAPLAELFSPDDAVFQARVNSVIQNISNRYQD